MEESIQLNEQENSPINWELEEDVLAIIAQIIVNYMLEHEEREWRK